MCRTHHDSLELTALFDKHNYHESRKFHVVHAVLHDLIHGTECIDEDVCICWSLRSCSARTALVRDFKELLEADAPQNPKAAGHPGPASPWLVGGWGVRGSNPGCHAWVGGGLAAARVHFAAACSSLCAATQPPAASRWQRRRVCGWRVVPCTAGCCMLSIWLCAALPSVP